MAQGSIRGLTDTSGTLTDTYAYNAFGDLYTQTGSTTNPYRYIGQRYDATTAQYYLRAREYDPAVGRFLSRDTWAVDTWNPVELNRYVYAAANPATWSDPAGYFGLAGYEKLQEEVAKFIPVLETGGKTLQITNARIGLAILKWTPWFEFGACLVTELTTDADLGPACDLRPDVDGTAIKRTFGRIWETVDENHLVAQLLRFVRESGHRIWHTTKSKGHLAFARYSLDGIFRNRSVWGVSRRGEGSDNLQTYLEELGEVVAPVAEDMYETFKVGKGGKLDPVNGWLRDVDSENQIFQHIARDIGNIADTTHLSGKTLYVEIANELPPCESCRWVARQFAKDMFDHYGLT